MSSSDRHTDRPRGRVILFLGAPGSGKGTQSSRLSSTLGFPCLSTGEMLRSEARRNTPAGFRLRRLLNCGALVSDAMVCSVVRTTLTRDTLHAGIVLDGFPRTVQQAAWLDSLLADFGLPVPTVLHLCVSRTELLRRLTARRYCAVCGATYNGGLRCENDGSALVGRDDDQILDAWIFCAGNRVIDCVWSAGRKVVTHGTHFARKQISARFGGAMRSLVSR